MNVLMRCSYLFDALHPARFNPDSPRVSYSCLVVARAAKTCLAFALALAGCKRDGIPVFDPSTVEPTPPPRDRMADDEPTAPPPYSKEELQRVLFGEHEAIANAERAAAELAGDPAPDRRLGAALLDLGVRRRFAAMLEHCQDTGRHCPPRIDEPAWSYDVDGAADPKLDTPLRFDRDDWRKIGAELHGRACACRTLDCIDSLGVAIDVLEKRPMREVVADDTAIASITHARECLFALRPR
jgi:hypothetical protein